MTKWTCPLSGEGGSHSYTGAGSHLVQRNNKQPLLSYIIPAKNSILTENTGTAQAAFMQSNSNSALQWCEICLGGHLQPQMPHTGRPSSNKKKEKGKHSSSNSKTRQLSLISILLIYSPSTRVQHQQEQAVTLIVAARNTLPEKTFIIRGHQYTHHTAIPEPGTAQHNIHWKNTIIPPLQE